MKNQFFKKRTPTAVFFLLILFFAALDLESKDLYESSYEPPIATCPTNLSSILAPQVSVTNSICTGVMAAGGAIGAPEGEPGSDPSETECPEGSSLQYRTDNSSPWSFIRPMYDQVTETNVYTRCICDMDATIVSLTDSVTTEPEACTGGDGCPFGLTGSFAPPVEITNSSCMSGIVSGGAVSGPLTSCPDGSKLQYSLNILDDESWQEGLDLRDLYDQTNSITISTRCQCRFFDETVSLIRSVVTTPGVCVPCPSNLSSIVPSLHIINSVCSTVGGTPSGGSITVPSNACPSGSALEYSFSSTSDATWTSNLPVYNQTISTVVYTRCICEIDNSMSSMIAENVTSPETTCPISSCDPVISATTVPIVRVTNSTCTAVRGTPSGGVLSAPTTACPSGSSIQYSINNGTNWSATLPSYNQSMAVTILTRCLCDADNSTISVVGRRTTIPEMCPIDNSAIPTMSQWGLIIFGLLVLNLGVVILYRLERILVSNG